MGPTSMNVGRFRHFHDRKRGGRYELILTEKRNGEDRERQFRSVSDQAGLLHVVSNAEFHERFTEYENAS
jgi:hypothetical protein